MLALRPAAARSYGIEPWSEWTIPDLARETAGPAADAVCWVFAEAPEPAAPDASADPPATTRLRVPLPPRTGSLGELVCLRRHSPWQVTPTGLDVCRYLAEPLADSLQRLPRRDEEVA